MRRFIKLRAVWSLLMGLSVALLFVANGASAVQPQTINYQGRLYDLTNSPLSGQYDFRFRLYDDALKTTLLWGPEEFTNQSVNNGYFSAPLGSVESFSVAGLDFTDQYYLTVQIKETAAGVWDDETDPPVAFNSYAYSFNTQKLDNPDGLVDIGLGIIAGYQLAAAETALAINTATGFNGTLLSLANDGAEVLSVSGDGTLHWMDGGYKDAYFNVENIVNPYASDPSLSAIFLDSSDDRSTIFGNIVYIPGNIGIGTMTPTTRFDLRGPMNLGGQPTAVVSPAGDGRLYYDNDTQDLMLSKNGGAYEPIMTTGDQVWQQNLLVLSPTDPLAEKIEISKSVNNLIGMKITNINEVDNYAGSVIELKGSGADYTNNLYFGKYGAGFWVPSWAGNGVLATDKNLVISAVGATSAINFQVGGGYTTPNNVASLTSQGLVLLPYGVAAGNTGTLALRELAANGSNRIALRSPDNLVGDVNLTLPINDGDSGQVLITDGSGILSWGAAAAPAVSNGIYNDAGTLKLGGDLVEMTYINHQGYDLIIREMAGEPETLFAGDNFKIIDSGDNREVRFGIGGVDSSGLSFYGNNQHDVFYRDDYLYVNSDSLAFSGLQYAADYSANFVDRSLVDKAYVDSHVGALTFQDVTDNTIASDGYVYYLTGAVEHEDDGGAAKIEVKTGGYEFELRSGDYGSAINLRTESAPGLDDGWMLIRDNRPTTRGLEYELDYSADYTNRSLVDKEYVDLHISELTLQGATDNSIAADGYVLANFGASYLEDLGSSAIFGANPGGKNITFGDGDGNGLFVYSYRDASNPAQIKLVDNRGVGNAHGIEYEADYSADYTNRSLVDKEYVDDTLATAANIYNTDGTLTGDRTLTSNGNLLTFTGSGGNQLSFQAADAPDLTFININPDEMEFSSANGTSNSSMVFNSGGMSLNYNGGVSSNNFFVSSNIEIQDDINSRGAIYSGDYEANFVPRSLVTKQYVDGLIVAGGGVTTLNLTATTFDGNFSYLGDTGYAAGNAVCEAEYPGSHFCATNEVITVIYSGDISGWAGTAWIAEGPPGYTANSNDCNGWTSNVATNLGAFWEFNNTSGGMGWLTNCASVKPVACCQ